MMIKVAPPPSSVSGCPDLLSLPFGSSVWSWTCSRIRTPISRSSAGENGTTTLADTITTTDRHRHWFLQLPQIYIWCIYTNTKNWATNYYYHYYCREVRASISYFLVQLVTHSQSSFAIADRAGPSLKKIIGLVDHSEPIREANSSDASRLSLSVSG